MATKMKLVSLADYDILTQLKQGQSIEKKDNNSETLLNSKHIADDIKAALYESLLQNIITSRTKAKQSNENSSTQMDRKILNDLDDDSTLSMSDGILLQSIPKTFRDNASLIMRELKNRTNTINWNHKGQVLFERRLEKNANIVDLLSYVLRPRLRWSKPPLGATRFIWYLKEVGIPTTILGSHMRDEYVRNTAEALKIKATPTSTPYNISRRQSYADRARGRASIFDEIHEHDNSTEARYEDATETTATADQLNEQWINFNRGTRGRGPSV